MRRFGPPTTPIALSVADGGARQDRGVDQLARTICEGHVTPITLASTCTTSPFVGITFRSSYSSYFR